MAEDQEPGSGFTDSDQESDEDQGHDDDGASVGITPRKRGGGSICNESPAKKGKKGKGNGKGSKKGGKKAGAKAKSKAGSRKCIMATCQETKVGNTRFCAEHRPMADGIWSQAQDAGKEEEAKAILYDEAKCAMALMKWQKENPPGKYRKKLIDWAQWQRTFDVKSKVTVREGETA